VIARLFLLSAEYVSDQLKISGSIGPMQKNTNKFHLESVYSAYLSCVEDQFNLDDVVPDRKNRFFF